jgi:hypothetical protein
MKAAAQTALTAERAAVASAEAEVASLGCALERLPATRIGEIESERRARIQARRAVAVGALVSARLRAAESAACVAAAEAAEAAKAAEAAEATSASSPRAPPATALSRPALAEDYRSHRERAVAAALKRNHEADLSNVVTAFARRVDALARRELVARELARKGEERTRRFMATRERKRAHPLRRGTNSTTNQSELS